MKKKTKILILGIGQSNFLNQLYGDVLRKTKTFQFSINGYFDLSRKNGDIEDLPFDCFYNFKDYPIAKWDLRKSLFLFAKTKLFWQILFFELSQNRTYIEIKKILFNFAKAKYRVEKLILPLNYDLYHFHFCIPQNLLETYFFPPNTKIICSFWGSDLMRITGVSNVFYVQKALRKAVQITVQTPEMAEMLYCKYGREFYSKVNSLRFTLDPNIFENIDFNKNNIGSINTFKTKHGIPENKIVIALGHNAFQENNHLLMIEQIKKLSQSSLENYCFVLHLSYGGNRQYIESLIRFTELERRLNIIILTDFLNPSEISLLRLSTDVLIQMPISDALSGAMTEVLYAGNIVITGNWLPYGILRRNDINFIEVGSFKDLPNFVDELAVNIKKYKKNNESNRGAIRSFLFPDKTTKDWINVLDKVSSN